MAGYELNSSGPKETGEVKDSCVHGYEPSGSIKLLKSEKVFLLRYNVVMCLLRASCWFLASLIYLS
jgi:hypothetical protein